MKMSMGEVMDRYTILRMKARLSEDAAVDLSRYEDEIMCVIGRLATEKRNLPDKGRLVIENLLTLQEANSKIWMLEASLRDEYKGDPSNDGPVTDAEFGRRARKIRDHNKMRVEAKKAIDVLFGDIPDVKVEHASQ